MTRTPDDTYLDRLRRQAEGALRRARSPQEVEPLLERIARLSVEGSDASLFAHRHLAELRIEHAPWSAALHLRKLLQVEQGDDVVHALMGLCQALLGNFRAAVASYRRALSIASRNPWYHHNLGHLLDVALAAPDLALPHLTSAHRLEPLEDEITASLAHCLASLGRLDEARAFALEAVRSAPRNRDHRGLLAWIERGAPRDSGPHVVPARPGVTERSQVSVRHSDPPGKRGRGGDRRSKAVLQVLERNMREAGFTARQLERARELWADFRVGRVVRGNKPEVYAAAVEYAIAIVHGLDGVTKTSIARRYGVAPTSVATRFGEIRDALALRPRDPRYGID